MGRVLAVVVVLALAGCAIPASTGVTIPTYSPVREALSWFPQAAPAVAVVRTDAQDPGLRRLAASGALAPLRRAAAARGVLYEQWRGLLGNPVAVGLPYVGAAPLAVLATADDDQLEVLASARVEGGHAAPAGSYRGAHLYAEKGWAFAVRDRVLIISETTRALRAALDTRAEDASFEAAQLNDVQPPADPPATFVRAYVDLEALVAQAPAAVRAVPVLEALGAAGVSVGASAEELHAVLGAGTAGTGLTADDLPGLDPRGTTALPVRATALAVADLAPLANAAEQALRRALPVTALEVDAVRTLLSGAGVALTPELLAGPAVITGAPALRLEPQRPAQLRAALARAVRRLHLRRDGGLYVRRRVRVGFVGGTFVAGRTSAARLRRLARAPLTIERAPVALRIPRAAPWFSRPVTLTLNGDPEYLTLRLASGF